MKSSLPIVYFYQSNPKVKYIKHTQSNDITVKTIAQSLKLKSHHIRFKIHIQDAEPKMYAWFDISNPNAKSPIINDTIYVKILELKDPNDSKITKKLLEASNGQQVQQINTDNKLQKDSTNLQQQQQQQQPQQLYPQQQLSSQQQVISPQIETIQIEKVKQESKNNSPVKTDLQKPSEQQQEQQLSTDQQSFWNSFQQFPQQQEQQQPKQQSQQQQQLQLQLQSKKQANFSVQSNDTVQSSNFLEVFEEFDFKPKFTKSQPISQSDLEAEIYAQQQNVQQGKEVNLLGDFIVEEEVEQIQPIVQHQTDQEIIDGRIQEKANQLKKQWDEEEQYNVQRQQAKDELESKILKWAFRDNVRNNIRLLLTTLGDVLQDMGEWNCNIGDLMTENTLKRKYMAAIRIVHPDKFQMCDNYQHRYIAERVFYELNQAYNIKNGKN